MEDECLSLTWNNHASTYRKTLSALREENMLIDVTLACDGKKYPAHKLVLVTCSDYFRDILGGVTCAHPIIYMRGVAAKELQALIDFMYTGQTDVPQSEVPNLLSTAEALQIKGLGVLEEKTNTSSKKNKVDSSHRKPHPDSAEEVNRPDNNSARRNVLKHSHSDRDEGHDNLYSNHYASSSPKRRKVDERPPVQSTEYTRSYSDNDKPSSSENPSSTIENLSRKYPPLATSTAASLLSDLFQQNQTSNISSNSHSTPSSTQPSSIKTNTSSAAENYAYKRVNDNVAGSGSSPSSGVRPLPSFQPGNQQQQGPSSPETNSASPRALNYSLSGLGREDFLTGGSLSHLLDDSSAGMADTPEKLLKSEIKEEALDFSSHTTTSAVSPLNESTVEEETRLYLDAFTRSAGLSPSLASLEKPVSVIINDVLYFLHLNHKDSGVDEISSVCKTYFTAKEVNAAKQLLADQYIELIQEIDNGVATALLIARKGTKETSKLTLEILDILRAIDILELWDTEVEIMAKNKQNIPDLKLEKNYLVSDGIAKSSGDVLNKGRRVCNPVDTQSNSDTDSDTDSATRHIDPPEIVHIP